MGCLESTREGQELLEVKLREATGFLVLSKLPKCILNLINAQLKHTCTVKQPNGFIQFLKVMQHIK